MELVDIDGDELGIKEVYGFGERCFRIAITQEEEYSAVVLTKEQLIQLRDYITRIV